MEIQKMMSRQEDADASVIDADGSNATTTSITSTSSLFDGVKQFFSGLLQDETMQSTTTNNESDSDESDTDPEEQVKELYGLKKKKPNQVAAKTVENIGAAIAAASSLTNNENQHDERLVSVISSMTGKGQTLQANKDFDITKFSRLAVKVRYDKTALEKRIEMEREWSMWKAREPTEEDYSMREMLKTREKFHEDEDYGR